MRIGKLREIIDNKDDNDEIAIRIVIDDFQEVIESDFKIELSNNKDVWLTARIVDASCKW